MADREAALLKVPEVAERLSCSVSNVYNLVAQGRLRAYRVGAGSAGLRFDDKQIEEFLRSTETGGQEEELPPPPPQPVKLKHLTLD